MDKIKLDTEVYCPIPRVEKSYATNPDDCKHDWDEGKVSSTGEMRFTCSKCNLKKYFEEWD